MAKTSSHESNLKVQKPQHGFHMIYYYSRCVGLWPFSIAYNSNHLIQEAHIDLFDWLWLLISMFVYSATLFCSYKNALTAFSSNEDYFFWHLIHAVSEVPSILFAAVGIVMDLFNRNILVNILRKFIIFDKRVGSL